MEHSQNRKKMWVLGMSMALTLGWSGTTMLGASHVWAKDDMEDPAWVNYAKVSGVSGNINSIGSDTLNNLMTLWAEGFRKQYPNVKIQIEGKGSSTAPPALIEGTAQLGPMSRKMKGKEIDAFEAKFGYKPTAFPVAVDALAVYVNKDNAIQGMTIEQVDAVFSKTRQHGYKENLTSWGQLGLTGMFADMPISIYGRNSASGTYGFFKEAVLENGDYKDEVKEQPGSASVVQGVTEDQAGIGYSGIGYRTSSVHALPLSMKAGQPFVEATYENATSGEYPLARYLFVYVNKAPNQPLSPIVREFLKYVYSREGQKVVIKDGYFPISEKIGGKQSEHLK
ncbi:phosphate ABC transporter substrate-binding protein [uncultured Nitrospira sp.]|uniref:PstS family phosphate ABC transporter substrate-binding protein n=1 Tax=uncultured Nitrospira sp. TaxID=157176 RepID=UPI00314056DE